MLDVHAVEKQFGGVRAVDGISFHVRREEIFALLGPNGAGKSTLVRMLMGLLRPDAGTLAYHIGGGAPQWPDSPELGYLPEDRGLYRDQPILRTLVYFAVLRGMGRQAAARAAEEWLDHMGLGERAAERLDRLSKGSQQKVQFAAAILHRPAFAVLDEPFAGLDPVNQEFFLQIIRELRDGGMTLLISAHQMDLVERLVDRVLLIDHGQEVLSGTLAEIRQRAQAGSRIRLQVAGAADLGALQRHPAVRRVERVGDEVWLFTGGDASLSDLLAAAASHLTITGIFSETVSLHDLFVQVVGGEARGAKLREAT